MRILSFRNVGWLCLVLAIGVGATGPALAVSPNFKTVCTSGCDYTSVQAAIDSITDSSATNVYTVFIDSGVLASGTSISTGGKDYINFVGRGIGVSVLRASLAWFNSVAAGADGNFFDLSGSTNVTIRSLTIDARTNDPATISNSVLIAAVKLNDTDKILFEDAEAQGLNYGMWEQTGSGGLIQVMNSKVGAVLSAIAAVSQNWHIFASDIRATQNGTESPYLGAQTIGVDVSGSIQVTIWGSHIHAESGEAGQTYPIAALRDYTGLSKIDVIGSTLHLKMTTSDGGSSTRAMAALLKASNLSTVNVVGTELLYETPASVTQGRVGGLYIANGGGTYNLVGNTIVDRGGSGGTLRGDLLYASISGSGIIRTAGTIIKTARSWTGSFPADFASLETTINTQKGTATLSAGQVVVTLPANSMPNATYAVAVTGNASETFYVINKATTGFTIKSSNGTSTAAVDWILTR